MKRKRTRILCGLFSLALLTLLTAACGENPEPPASRSGPAVSDSFTFFSIGKNGVIDNRQRKNLEKTLGDAAIERRGILNLELNDKTFLADHFPELERMNRQLNSEIGLQVKHRIVRLMYRYAKQKGLNYDLVELVFAEKTHRPLLIRLHFKTDAAAALETLIQKYGPPGTLAWGREKAAVRYWQKENDYLFYSVVPRRGNKVEYLIAIYFTDAIEALIQSEKADQKTGIPRKTGF